MSLERLKTAVDQILTRLPAVRGLGEQATKQALILPLLDALGYDIWNPAEVCPEHCADFAIKKAGQKEKVDLAIFMDGQARIFFEVKPVECGLDGHEGQLARYFNAITSVSLAVLTDGIEYRFFTDTGDPNVMDAAPFYTLRLDNTDQGLEVLSRFHKSVFSAVAIREFATELIYTAKMVSFLRKELDLRDGDPSDGLVRWILAGERMYDGRITANVVERFTPITRNALQIVLRDIVRRSLAAIDSAVAPSTAAPIATPSEPVTATDPVEMADSRARIITTERELECFAIVKNEFEHWIARQDGIYEPSLRRTVDASIEYKDTTGYFAVYINKPSWWCLRIVMEARQPWVGFNVSEERGMALLAPGMSRLDGHPYAQFRIPLTSPSDLLAMKSIILASFQKTVEDRRGDAMAAGA